MDFYTTVILIATIILILILTYLGLIMSGKFGSSLPFPPVQNNCPDYWEYDGGYCQIPKISSKNWGDLYDATGTLTKATTGAPGYNSQTGVNKTPGINFNDKTWSATAGKGLVCAVKDWVKTHNVVFDTVSNYNKC